MRALRLLAFISAFAGRAATQLPANRPEVHVALGMFAVDTSRPPVRDVFRLWRAYLSDRPDSVHPSPYWSRREQAEHPDFDFVRGAVYQGFPSLYPKITIVDLAPVVGRAFDSAFVIRTLIAGVFDSARDVKPLALFRVYAVREDGRWVLGNALPRLTRDWPRTTIGHVTFVYPPAHRFNQTRARGSARFVDSTAAAFGLPVPDRIEYYETESLSDTFRAMGLDYFPTGPDTAGGRANVANKMVFVGSSTDAEGNRHELAHIVLQPLFGITHRLIYEGFATWVGGSAGLAYPELLPGLKRYLLAHPEVTLDSVFTHPAMRQGTLDVGYDGAAVLCDLVYAKGGVAAIRDLTNAGSSASDVLGTAARLLAVPRSALDSLWRQRVVR